MYSNIIKSFTILTIFTLNSICYVTGLNCYSSNELNGLEKNRTTIECTSGKCFGAWLTGKIQILQK